MVVTLPVDKIDNIIQECKVLLKKQEATIREVAKVIGILVSAMINISVLILYVF
jgi:hypothetical protein